MKYKALITFLSREVTKAILIGLAIVSAFTIFFPSGKLNISMESIKQLDSLIKITKAKTDSIYLASKKDTANFADSLK